MAYHIGDCPKCGARLLVEYKDANEYEEIDVTESTLDLTYVARCWKCGAIVEADIQSNIDEQAMDIKLTEEQDEVIADCLYKIVPTRNLSEAEAKEG